MGKTTGVNKWFSRLKGYGYINPDDDGYDTNHNDLNINDDDYRDYYDLDRRREESRAKKSTSRHK